MRKNAGWIGHTNFEMMMKTSACDFMIVIMRVKEISEPVERERAEWQNLTIELELWWKVQFEFDWDTHKTTHRRWIKSKLYARRRKNMFFSICIEYERHLKLMSATPVTSWLENLIFDYIELLALFLMSLYITFHLQWRNYGCTRNDHNSGCVHDAIQCNIHRHSF